MRPTAPPISPAGRAGIATRDTPRRFPLSRRNAAHPAPLPDRGGAGRGGARSADRAVGIDVASCGTDRRLDRGGGGDRESVVWGKSVSGRVGLGGRRIIKKKKQK